ncbi:HEAT repeat domain-containing protein [Microcystis aeruginosa BLCCF108]|uniref:HEAT repeat domain-containing protein n=1 Tax=Microcystis aeruginosa BLCC-F108 TaxID=2755317 RepID=A0A841UMI9_MICAE|nr:HEAT repeat domain-containing protein [Microcystis aeruginosa]MBC1189447.1 HEAT repeat domain-containing protein [Microcystis aeruginosa BLCC-F108]
MIKSNLDYLQESMVKILNEKGDTLGSGFIIREDGYLITCHHVIYLLPSLRVNYQGKEYASQWCQEYSNPEVDIAILKIKIENAKPVKIVNFQAGLNCVTVYGFPREKEKNFPEGFDVNADKITVSAPLNLLSTYPNNKIEYKNPWNKLPDKSSNFLTHRINAKVDRGTSGGAVFSEELGGVLGVIQSSKTDESYVIRWDNILDILDKLGLEPTKNAVCRFLEKIQDEFQYLQFFHTRQKISLLKQYIPIEVTLERRYNHEIETWQAYTGDEGTLKKIYALKGFTEEQQREENKKVQVDWEEAKDKHNKMMILADPGMGKSTLLRMEALKIAREELGKLGVNTPQPFLNNREKVKVKDVILPLYFRLSELANKLAEKNDDIINIIPQLIDKNFQIESIVKQKLEQGKCVLFLDALDEVSSIQLHKLNTKLENFLDNSPCKIYLTSRIVGYSGKFSKEVKEVEIVPFTDQKTAEYIKTWFVNAEGYLENDLVSADGLIEELKNKPQIQGLAQNPLLLSLICSLYQTQDLILPAKRNEVYKQAVDYMLRDWVENRKLVSVSGGKRIAKIRLLEIVAYELSCREEEIFIFQEEDFFNVLERYLRHEEVSTIFQQSNSDELMIELCEEDGIIQKFHEKGDQYLFLHRTFQEYFTACYLHQRIKKNQEDGIALVKAHFWDHDWHETIILLAGMMSDASLLLEAILQEKDDIFATLLILASNCLAESKNIQDSLINQIVDKLYKVWQRDFSLEYINKTMVTLGKTFPVMRRRLENALKDSPWYVRDSKFNAAELLGKIGNPESISALSAALDDSEKRIKESAEYALRKVDKEDRHILIFGMIDREEAFRGWALKALGEIGNSEALPTIIRALNYSDWFRDNAAIILGKMNRKQTLALPSLISTLSDSEKSVRFWGVKALGEIGIGNSETIQALITALNDVKTRGNAVEALSKINNSAVVSALIETIKNSDGDFRSYAAVALSKITNPDAVPVLIEAVNHSAFHVYIRYSAVQALGNIGNPEAVSALIAVLNDSEINDIYYAADELVRNKAVEALSKIGTPQAVSGLIEALNHPYQEVAGKAAEALLNIGTEKAYLGLMTALNHLDENVREYAVEALGEINNIGSTAAMPILIEALNNPYQEVRSSATMIFAKFPSGLVVLPEFRQAFIASLNDSDKTGRDCVETALSLLLNPEEVSALMTALINSDETIRNNAIESLGGILDKIGNPETMSGLSMALEDSNNLLRCYSAILLTVYLNGKGNPEALPILIKALNHSDEYVRRMAVSGLGESDNPEVVPALIMMLNDSDYDVRGRAVMALANISHPKAIPALIEALNDVNKYVRFVSADALSKIGNLEVIPTLIEGLNDSEENIRVFAVTALSKINNLIVIPVSIEALNNSDKNVRALAAQTLGNIGNSEAIQALIETLNDEDDQVQYIAQLALSQIGNSETISALIDVIKYSEHDARWYAKTALIDIGNSEVVSALIVALKDSNKYVRSLAAEALGEIGNPEAVTALTEALTEADDYVLEFVAEALEKMGDLRTLKQIIYRWDIDIYESNVFLLARKLAIRYRKTKTSVIPVYRQRFRFLVKRIRGIIVMLISSLRDK